MTFQDLQSGRGPSMKGWAKIERCCAQAAKDDWRYVWIDSCCIDKSSSAELSEAINSMFQWYRQAEVCFTYLSDVPSGGDWKTHMAEGSDFRASKWFTRGWTLQELLAPSEVIFFDKDWVDIGSRSAFASLITEVTGILDVDDYNIDKLCIATVFSWASKRETTRIEDRAYSLMGLFNVHMPLLYGEGNQAFMRLQMELLKVTDDETIFAWTIPGAMNFCREGMLAGSLECFALSNICKQQFIIRKKPHFMTNQGLRVDWPLILEKQSEDVILPHYLVPLNCTTFAVSQPQGLPREIILSREPVALEILFAGGGYVVRMNRETRLFSLLPEMPLQDYPTTTFTIPQQKSRIGWDRAEDKQRHVFVNATSLLAAGYSYTFSEDNPGRYLSPSYAYSYKRNTFKPTLPPVWKNLVAEIKFDHGSSKLSEPLVFTNDIGECLIILISLFKGVPHIISDTIPIATIPNYIASADRWRHYYLGVVVHPSRYTKLLDSGKSISVESVKKGDPTNPSKHIQWVNILVDSKGSLRWPEQPTDSPSYGAL